MPKVQRAADGVTGQNNAVCSFVVYLSVIVLLNRKSVSAWTSHNGCHFQRHHSKDSAQSGHWCNIGGAYKSLPDQEGKSYSDRRFWCSYPIYSHNCRNINNIYIHIYIHTHTRVYIYI